jgi:hypothetical protein
MSTVIKPTAPVDPRAERARAEAEAAAAKLQPVGFPWRVISRPRARQD